MNKPAMKIGNFSVQFAKGCAWRAIYLSIGEKQIAHLGIDPTASVPSVFGQIGGKSLRVPVRVVRWHHPMSPLRRKLYTMQERLLHKLDGRY